MQGLQVTDVTPENVASISPNGAPKKGALVIAVPIGSATDDGLRPGLVITGIQIVQQDRITQRGIDTAAEFQQLRAGCSGGCVLWVRIPGATKWLGEFRVLIGTPAENYALETAAEAASHSRSEFGRDLEVIDLLKLTEPTDSIPPGARYFVRNVRWFKGINCQPCTLPGTQIGMSYVAINSSQEAVFVRGSGPSGGPQDPFVDALRLMNSNTKLGFSR